MIMRYDVQDVINSKSGDDDSFAKLYQSISLDLYKFAYYTLGSKEDAEDVVSETIIDVYYGIKKLKTPEAFGSWTIRILSAKCKKKIKKYVQEKNSIDYDSLQLAAKTQDIEQRHDINIIFNLLSEEERFIIACTVFGGYKSNEIGQILKVKPSTIRSKLSRAYAKMREELVTEVY